MIKEYKYNKRDTRKYLYRVLFRLLIYFTVLLALLIVYKGIRDSYLNEILLKSIENINFSV